MASVVGPRWGSADLVGRGGSFNGEQRPTPRSNDFAYRVTAVAVW